MEKRALVRRGDGVRAAAKVRAHRRRDRSKRSQRARIKRRSFVEPLRDLGEFDRILEELRKDDKIREALLLQVMYLSHLRVSDALRLRFCDFIRPDGTLNRELVIIEKKTGKQLRLRMFDALGEIILNYYVRYGSPARDYYIFRSDAVNKTRKNLPWCRAYIWQLVKEYAKRAGVTDNVGTHTFRKTWAYHAYMDGEMDIEEIQNELGHSNIRDTLIYCGIDDERRKAQHEAMGEKMKGSLAQMRYEKLPAGVEIYRRKRKRKLKKASKLSNKK